MVGGEAGGICGFYPIINNQHGPLDFLGKGLGTSNPRPLFRAVGTTDIISVAEFEALGYDAVIYPASSMRAAMGAVTRLFADLRATGHVKASLPKMQTRKELYETLAYTPGEEWVMPAHFNK